MFPFVSLLLEVSKLSVLVSLYSCDVLEVFLHLLFNIDVIRRTFFVWYTDKKYFQYLNAPCKGSINFCLGCIFTCFESFIGTDQQVK